MKNGKQIDLAELHEELQVSNRLTVLSLIQRGIQQKDVAAAMGVSESTLSTMFPKGLLRRVAAMGRPTEATFRA